MGQYKKVKKIQLWPGRKLFPNIVTLIALCFGITAIRMAIEGDFKLAVTSILIAAFVDALDGRVARLLNATSDFGAELDSLADFANFGIAPSITLYLWALKDIDTKGLGWAVALFFAICCVIRLARFNSDIGTEEDLKPYNKIFFTGLPSPAGAILALTPMMLHFRFSDSYKYFDKPGFILFTTIFIALLMPSRIRAFSGKKVLIKHEFVPLILIIAGLVVSGLIIDPWFTLPILGIIYLLSMPFSMYSYYKYKKEYK